MDKLTVLRTLQKQTLSVDEAAGLDVSGTTGYISRSQPGPMTLPEVVEIFKAACMNSNGAEDPEGIKEAIRMECTRKARGLEQAFDETTRLLKRGLIKEVFEGVPDSAAGPAAGLEKKAGEEYYTMVVEKMRTERPEPFSFCTGLFDFEEVTPDLLAVYVSAFEGEEQSYRSGIYFCGDNIIDFLCALEFTDAAEIETVLRTVAVHELFHAHMNRRLSDGGKGHSHRGESPEYCRLEEAAANRAALEWLRGNMKSGTNEMETKLTASLFKKHGSGGLPGYGEYSKLDIEVPAYLPEMIAEGNTHPDPEGYGEQKQNRKLTLSPMRQDAAAAWVRLVGEMDMGLVPMYVSVV